MIRSVSLLEVTGGHDFYIFRPSRECGSFVDECPVQGLMDCEAMSPLENGAFELQEFTIT